MHEPANVKKLEDLGIGRPSTYAEIVSKVLSRDYVEKRDKQLVPTRLGTTKTHGLRARFPDVVDYDFTARIERDLDAVESGDADWVQLVDRIYKPFKKIVEAEMSSKEPGVGWPRPEPSDRICEKCGSPMVKRWGPNSNFYACTAYPKCKNIVDENPAPAPEIYADRKCSPMPLGHNCPKCREGELIKIGAAKGRRPFWGCANYATEMKCDFRLFTAPVKEACPQCAATFLTRAGGKSRPVLKCLTEGCGFERALDGTEAGDAEGDDAAPSGAPRTARPKRAAGARAKR